MDNLKWKKFSEEKPLKSDRYLIAIKTKYSINYMDVDYSVKHDMFNSTDDSKEKRAKKYGFKISEDIEEIYWIKANSMTQYLTTL